MEEVLKQQRMQEELIYNFSANTLKVGKAKLTRGYIQARITLLEKYWTKFNENHQGLVLIAAAENDSYFKDKVYDSVETAYSFTLGSFYEMINEFENNDRAARSEVQGSAHGSALGFGQGPSQGIGGERPERREVNTTIKLPHISLPKFSGDVSNWTSFHDLFKTLVIDHPSLANVQKLHHLKSALSGQAEILLRQFAIQDNNFEPAWEFLKKRFANKRLLLKSHFDRFLAQPRLNSSSPDGVRGILDTSNECMTSISNLLTAEQRYDSLILHLLTQRLDNKTLEAWENSIKGEEQPQTFRELSEFLEEYCRTLDLVHASKGSSAVDSRPKQSHGRNPEPRTTKVFHATTSSPAVSCACCNSNHPIYKCFRFRKLSAPDRQKMVATKKLCSKCLSSDHNQSLCTSSYRCSLCSQPHHYLLHNASTPMPNTTSTTTRTSDEQRPPSNQEVVQAVVHTHHTVQKNDQRILLATALVKVITTSGKSIILRALLDQGSQASFITRSAANISMSKLSKRNSTIRGLGTSTAGNSTHIAQFTIQSIHDAEINFAVEAIVMPNLTEMLPSTLITIRPWAHLNDIQLADPHYFKPEKIDIVLGADMYGELLRSGLRKGSHGAPMAQETALGWILSGSIDNPYNNFTRSQSVVSCFTEVDVNNQLRKFWELEEMSSERAASKEDAICERFFKTTHERAPDGKYIVQLPFKADLPTFGDSRNQALRRLLQMERRLNCNPSLKTQYTCFMQEYLQLGHMIPVQNDAIESEHKVFYLPHHAVVKSSSTTTKLRVVFDASAKDSNGTSLNDQFHIGPTIQQDLMTILLRWRKHRIAIISDVEKMYRQIWVHDDHQPYQRILWRNESNQIQDFQLTTITYGTACAPFLAIRTIQQLAEDTSQDFPIASKHAMSDMYVDDLITGCDTIDDAMSLQKETTRMFKVGGFILRKWASNCADIIQSIPVEHRESIVTFEIGRDQIIKTLGIYWNTNTDNLNFGVQLSPSPEVLTKRNLLSDVAKLFDPMGFLAPVIISAKILFQSLWLKGLTWDEPLPNDIKEEWVTLRSNLHELTHITIPRWIGTSKHTSQIELHGFCDASIKAYAAVVYCRTKEQNSYKVELLTSKTRVAPIKRVSLPNLELCGATLLARLLTKTVSAMMFDNPIIFAWTDSTIVLDWLQSNSHKQTFVANRISTILDHLRPDQWRHVKSGENPADVASRGICPTKLKGFELWWKGPKWLHESCDLPPTRTSNRPIEIQPTPDIIIAASATTSCERDFECTINKYSSITTLIRVIAYCLRFCQNSRMKDKSHRKFTCLSSEEHRVALLRIIKYVQASNYQFEITRLTNHQHIRSSRLVNLAPFICNAGLLRVGGRLTKADITFNQKHPILLPPQSSLTKLIILKTHRDTMHGGAQLTLSTIRQTYWIPKARTVIRGLIQKCVTCKRFNATCENQFMSDLPGARINISKAFSHTGVDYAGPFDLRQSTHRGRGTFKGYVAIFVCLSTKAVHIELAGDLTSNAFIGAFKRFIARRGHCSDMYSDNGTNFVGAQKQLHSQFLNTIQTITFDLKEEFACRDTQWHFIPPSAPHFGGLWEAAVKAMKYHLNRVIGRTILNYEEFNTILSQIEAALNSRPICPMSSDPNDIRALTPGHFLTGGPMNSVPEPSLLNIRENRLDRWKLVEKINQDIWQSWSRDYLNELQQRPKKWSDRQDNIGIGDVVIIRDDRLPACTWPLGRVIDTHPGQDGLVRVVTIKTKGAQMKRPVAKLVRLQFKDDQAITQCITKP